jgi:hypothetical protein
MERLFLKEKNINDYIRVTEVLYPLSGLNTIDSQILKNAADRGTKVHEIIEAMEHNLGVAPISEEISGYIESYKKWLPKTFIDKPDRFYCDIYGITGECDAIYEDEGGLVLVDYKTPKNESKTWCLQGSAYAYLARQAGYMIERVEFVKLSKEGKDPKVFTYLEDFNTFVKCLDVFKYFFKKRVEESVLDYL